VFNDLPGSIFGVWHYSVLRHSSLSRWWHRSIVLG
jgi:hypothetical protein